jgi:hypothetical protein
VSENLIDAVYPHLYALSVEGSVKGSGVKKLARDLTDRLEFWMQLKTVRDPSDFSVRSLAIKLLYHLDNE